METKEKKDRKKPKLVGIIVLAVLIAVGSGVGIYWLFNMVNYVSTDDAAIDGDHVNVSAKILGRIRELLVSEGTHVEEGQLLIQLEDADLRAQRAQAAASLNYARQNLILAKVNLDKTQDDYKRAKSLFDSGAITREQYDHASKALDTANAQYSIAQSQIDTSQAQLGVIETQLQNSRITAPISGTIAKQSYMPGDVVQPGQAIFSINDLSHVWVTANFEETKIRQIRVDAPVEVTVDAHPGHPFKGHVARVGAGIVAPAFTIGDFTKTTQRVPIKIVLDPFPDTLLVVPGMSVEVKVKKE